MTERLTPTLFYRHNRPLHTLWFESQAWFCAHELGRLSGHFFDGHCMRKLDPDQYRAMKLLRYGTCQEMTMVSESGAYTLLAHHHVPENRHLRWWLTHEVVAVLRDAQANIVERTPQLVLMSWAGGSTTTALYWQGEPWLKVRDMPVMLASQSDPLPQTRQQKLSWRECARRALRSHGL